MNPANPNPPFFGVRVSQPGVSVNQATSKQLQYENDYTKQTFFGTNGDTVFGIFTSAVTGQQGMGMQIVNTAGQVVFEMNGQTWYWLDTLGNVVMMAGLLPVTNVYGWAVATPGNTLAGQV